MIRIVRASSKRGFEQAIYISSRSAVRRRKSLNPGERKISTTSNDVRLAYPEGEIGSDNGRMSLCGRPPCLSCGCHRTLSIQKGETTRLHEYYGTSEQRTERQPPSMRVIIQSPFDNTGGPPCRCAFHGDYEDSLQRTHRANHVVGKMRGGEMRNFLGERSIPCHVAW